LLYLLEGKANIKKVHFTIKVTSFFSVYMQKSWKLCYVKAIYKRVDERGSATEQHKQRKMLNTTIEH